MRNFIIQIEDYNGNELMSFKMRGASDFKQFRYLHDCVIVDKYQTEDDTTVYIIQQEIKPN